MLKPGLWIQGLIVHGRPSEERVRCRCEDCTRRERGTRFHFVEPSIIVDGAGWIYLLVQREFLLKNARFLTNWAVALVSSLAAASLIYQQTRTPLDTAQQTVITSSTRVIVVLIPGFPIESMIIGALLGLTILFIVRRRGINQKREP